MTPQRWAVVREIFEAAVERDPVARAEYLNAACAGDDELRREVESLLGSHARADDFLSEPPVELSGGPAPPQDLSSEVLEGLRVGAYQLQTCLGRGGMSSVWMAARVDHEYEQKVAIKLVRRGMDSREILRRFRIERQVLARLDHPNIARLLDGGSTPDGLPYLVMEYVDGTPIDVYCDQQKSSVTERLKLFRAVCSAVEYAHRSLVVHRDIKAGNILVTAQGVPKLLDFGIAKVLRSDSISREATRFDQRPMTVAYASPEQIRGGPITTTTDVYSLGVLLYKLLTGRLPHDSKGRTSGELERAICEEEPRKPSAVALADPKASIPDASQRLEGSIETLDRARRRLRKKLAGDLDTIILKALRKEPQGRYASVEQFSEDVRCHLEGIPVRARGESLRYRAGKFARRHVAGMAALFAIALALVAGTVVSGYYARQASRERAQAERRFTDVRKLAHFVLFELDPAMQSGMTPARKLLIRETLDYLSRLETESGTDVALRREIMEAYFRLGDIQNNLYHANLGDAAGAAESFHKAYEIAQAIYRGRPSDPEARRDAARAEVHLGDLAAFGGDRSEALRRYGAGLAGFEALAAENPRDLRCEEDVMSTVRQIGFVQFETGDVAGAAASFRRDLQIAEGLQAIEAAGGKPAREDTRRQVAAGYDHLGEALAKSGSREEGIADIQKSLAIYRELFDADPENPAALRSVITAEEVLGDALLAAGRSSDAIAMYHSALERLDAQGARDPQNVQTQRDTTVALGRISDALIAAGREQAARPVTERALKILAPLIEVPQPSEMDLQQYAWILVTTPFEDLRDAAAAMRAARKAVAITNESDPAMLDLLARAQAVNHDYPAAVETEQKALALLPRGSQSDVRSEMESNLARFRSKIISPKPNSR